MSTLIKDTTKEERIALIKSWIPDDDGLNDCEIDLWDMYADYINGIREISEINMDFTPEYITKFQSVWEGWQKKMRSIDMKKTKIGLKDIADAHPEMDYLQL